MYFKTFKFKFLVTPRWKKLVILPNKRHDNIKQVGTKKNVYTMEYM
jgi:hypothetical protein